MEHYCPNPSGYVVLCVMQDITPTNQPRRCDCGSEATNQALYRRDDGSHFLGSATCDEHRTPLGRPQYARTAEVIDHMEVAR